jgi:hypothetical protein
MWMPIPLRKPGKHRIYSVGEKSNDWISGIAFSKNLWNHAKNSAIAYAWGLNGSKGVTWAAIANEWNND